MYFKKLLTFLFVHAGARVFFVIAQISSSAAPLRDWNAPPVITFWRRAWSQRKRNDMWNKKSSCIKEEWLD